MELWLKYKNDQGDVRRVAVNSEKFIIGRHSDNDLCIPLNQLSRLHAEIDRYEDAYILTDAGSSNGTKLNGRELYNPTALKNGDRINLGGGVEIEVEIKSAAAARKSALSSKDETQTAGETPNLPAGQSAEQSEAETIKEAESVADVKAADFVPAIAQSAAPKKSGMGIFFFIAPLMVFVVLVFGGLILWLAGGSKDNDIGKNSKKGGFTYSDDNDNDKPNKNGKNDNSGKTPSPSPSVSNGNNSTNNSSSGNDTKNSPVPTPAPISSEKDAVEKNALAFLRRIPNGNPNPVLNDKQLNEINQAVKSVKSSSALKDGLQAVKKSFSQIEALAKSKNLRAQFLAAAALAKGGDPVSAAQSMAGDLNNLSNQIGDETSDDILIAVAVYEGGGKGNLQGMLGNLAKGSSGNATQVRSIWYLREKGKINEAQYQFALKFLAVGAIMQNPKDFGVQSEAVVFN